MPPTFFEYAQEVATVLDDNPTVRPQEILGFESTLLMAGFYETVLVYRDWLEEKGCKTRMAQLNWSLTQELKALERLSKEVCTEQSQRFVSDRIAVLKRVLEGQEAYPRQPFQGTLVIRFPEQEILSQDGSRKLA
jgi:hypothetical protein